MATQKQIKAVFVILGDGERSIWRRIGTAFVNRDGSLNVLLDALPVGGKIHIRDLPAAEAPAEAAAS